jgi:SpoVK/Ycf46/Vps4 family AAA+-type ATPase
MGLDEEIAAVRGMKVADIKQELKQRGLSTNDMFEKDEFVKRLAQARVSGGEAQPLSASVRGAGGASPPRMASEDEVVAFNVQVEADGLQGRSKLEKAMREWFEGEGQRTRFVLWGPGGTGKSTLALKFAAGQVERKGAAWSSVRLVFALSVASMAQGYAGLLGESCMRAGVAAGAEAVCHFSASH